MACARNARTGSYKHPRPFSRFKVSAHAKTPNTSRWSRPCCFCGVTICRFQFNPIPNPPNIPVYFGTSWWKVTSSRQEVPPLLIHPIERDSYSTHSVRCCFSACLAYVASTRLRMQIIADDQRNAGCSFVAQSFSFLFLFWLSIIHRSVIDPFRFSCRLRCSTSHERISWTAEYLLWE